MAVFSELWLKQQVLNETASNMESCNSDITIFKQNLLES